METELFLARINDCAEICYKTEKPKFFGFLSKEESVLAEKILASKNVNYKFFGGYDEAERVLLGCFPEWDLKKEFPILPLTFIYRKADNLRHRDFLGSLMGLGLKREAIGDILIEEGRAVIFCLDEIADFILSQLSKVGRTGVKAELGFSNPLPTKGNLSEFRDTVASDRLDCIVSALCNTSRSAALVKINEGMVSVNSVVIEKPTKAVLDGDIVTIRGYGKFIIESLTERTKKRRIILKYKKYV